MTGSKAAHPRISIVVAYAANRVIGKDGKIPWRLPEDLKRFKALTMGHAIVMGRKTWESIGRLLAGRRHVIISRRPGYTVAGATVAASLDDAIAACVDQSDVFIIGGGKIYRLALALADRIYATEIEGNFEGDTFFPPLDMAMWKETRREARRDENISVHYSFITFDRDLPCR